MNTPQEFRNFVDIIGDLDDGRVVEEMTHQLREVVRAVRTSQKKGSVTLKIDIELDGRQFVVNASVKPTIPTPAAGMTIFFANDDGELRKDDPKQIPLKNLDRKPEPLRTVGGELERGA
jgi:hypothetical protein